MKNYVKITVYKNQFGYSLCVEDKDGDGYRASGPDMDGTNREVCHFFVDSDELVKMIRDVEFEKGDAS